VQSKDNKDTFCIFKIDILHIIHKLKWLKAVRWIHFHRRWNRMTGPSNIPFWWPPAIWYGNTWRRHLSRFMYQVNKSTPHRRSASLTRPSRPGNRLISIRDLDCPADRVSRQSDLLFQRTRRVTAELSGVSTRRAQRYRGHFYLHSLSIAPAALARRRPRSPCYLFRVASGR